MSVVNVEIPKVDRVTYGGAAYVKVDGDKAQAGDLIRIYNDEISYITDGGFYEVTDVDSWDDPQIIDDGGDDFDAGGLEYEVYRKEPAEYREVKRKARVGERIKIVYPIISCGQYRKGDVLKVREPDASWKKSVNAEGVAINIRHDEYVVLEPIPTFEKGEKVRLIDGGGADGLYGFTSGKTYEVFDTSENPGGWTGRVGIKTDQGYEGYAKPEQLEKVAEEAKSVKPGDWVRITQNQSNWPVGTIVKVVEVHSRNIRATDGRSTLYSSRYEKVAHPEYARVIGISPSMSGFGIGDIVKISGSGISHAYELLRNDGLSGYGNSEHLAPATKEEYEEFTKPKPKPKLAVGDYAKVVKNIDGDEEFNVGDIRKVTKVDEDDDELPYATRNLDGSDFIWHYAAELVKATDEEVDKAKLEAKEAAKWSAIGRKPGEFKLGDLVEVTGSMGGHKVGTIGELVSGDHFYCPREFGVKANGQTYDHTDSGFKLVTPVEQRFDRK